jgi:hypothetical protein
MHVTLGVTVYTFVELMTLWLQSSKEEPACRRALPPGFANRPELQQNIADKFSRLAEDFRRKLDSRQLLAEFTQRVKDGYPGQSEFGSEFELDVAVIGPQTGMKALAPGQYTITAQGENIALKFAGKTLVMSRRACATLDEMCKRPSFRLSELPHDLKEETKLALARHLYQEGFLRLSK